MTGAVCLCLGLFMATVSNRSAGRQDFSTPTSVENDGWGAFVSVSLIVIIIQIQ
jgi:hypothetical protein